MQRDKSFEDPSDPTSPVLAKPRGHEVVHSNHITAYILVLGDIGRSPRMCNHAVSLADEGFDVTVIGYGGSTPNSQVTTSPNIKIKNLRPFPQWMSNWLPRPVSLFLKVFWQLFTIFLSLPFLSGPSFILMQNPPTIPTLIVTYFYTLIHRRTKLVLDWHNYGYSILELSFDSQRHPLVMLAEKIEAFFGPRVDAAFCVSKAMKRDLYNKWSIDATVLYDRPLASFQPSSVEEKHNLFMKLSEHYPEVSGEDEFSTAFTETSEDDGSIRLKANRPAILVSSTSWTPDEDFSILFEALEKYESHCHTMPSSSLPDLVCVITGRGPQKEYYRELIQNQEWQHIKVIMPWLEPQDYPIMLGSADLGVCLHTSSSGVDLPMKVVDMFGCGLPVAAKNFPALPELVKNGINGHLFDHPEELFDIIIQWFDDFTNLSYERRRRPYIRHLERYRTNTWPDYWKAVALPILLGLLQIQM